MGPIIGKSCYMQSEIEKLQAFLDAEKARGLVDFKVTTAAMLEIGPTLSAIEWLEKVQREHVRRGVTLEILAGEINNMLNAPTVPDEDLV